MLKIGKVTFSISKVRAQFLKVSFGQKANLVLAGRRSSWTASSSPNCLLRVFPLDGTTSLTSGVVFSLFLSLLEMVFLAGPS